jgi:hypothetical protein
MKNDCIKIGDTHRNQSPKMGGSESQGHVIIIVLHGYFALLEASEGVSSRLSLLDAQVIVYDFKPRIPLLGLFGDSRYLRLVYVRRERRST